MSCDYSSFIVVGDQVTMWGWSAIGEDPKQSLFMFHSCNLFFLKETSALLQMPVSERGTRDIYLGLSLKSQ